MKTRAQILERNNFIVVGVDVLFVCLFVCLFVFASPASRIKSKQQHMYSARPCESQESNAAALSSFRTSMQSGILSNER